MWQGLSSWQLEGSTVNELLIRLLRTPPEQSVVQRNREAAKEKFFSQAVQRGVQSSVGDFGVAKEAPIALKARASTAIAKRMVSREHARLILDTKRYLYGKVFPLTRLNSPQLTSGWASGPLNSEPTSIST